MMLLTHAYWQESYLLIFLWKLDDNLPFHDVGGNLLASQTMLLFAKLKSFMGFFHVETSPKWVNGLSTPVNHYYMSKLTCDFESNFVWICPEINIFFVLVVKKWSACISSSIPWGLQIIIVLFCVYANIVMNSWCFCVRYKIFIFWCQIGSFCPPLLQLRNGLHPSVPIEKMFQV
jgi:hypothetical protein